MDGRLKAALTKYLIVRGVKPRTLGDIVMVQTNTYHDKSYEPHESDCDTEGEVEIWYDKWTEDATHSYQTIHTVGEDEFEDFLTFIANYGQPNWSEN